LAFSGFWLFADGMLCGLILGWIVMVVTWVYNNGQGEVEKMTATSWGLGQVMA